MRVTVSTYAGVLEATLFEEIRTVRRILTKLKFDLKSRFLLI